MDEKIGEIIKKSRLRMGYDSLGELSRASSVPVSTLSRIEAGIQRPSLDTLKKLVSYLDVPYEDLVVAAGHLGQEQIQAIVSNAFDGLAEWEEERKMIEGFGREYFERGASNELAQKMEAYLEQKAPHLLKENIKISPIKDTEPLQHVDLVDLFQNENIQLAAGNQPITAEQRLNIVRVLDNPSILFTNKSTLPILGAIRAGTPLLADGNYEGELEVPADIEADFALRVKGDSMIGVGVHDGDYAICRETKAANSGQIVVALRDLATGYCEATLKFYSRENANGKAVLRAANPDFEDIPMGEGWRTSGIMVALLKKEAPIYKIYNNYLAARDINLDKWIPVLEKAFQLGIKPEQVKSVIEMIYQSSQK